MSVRRVCDRCGKEVSSWTTNKFIQKGFIDKQYDFCSECLTEFKKWLKGDVRTDEDMPSEEEAVI